MPISFGHKSKFQLNKATEMLSPYSGLSALDLQLTGGGNPLASKAPSRLVDLRCPDGFCAGFIPGSYSVPDLDSVAAARRSGLFSDREIYLLTDDPDQLHLCCDDGELGANSKVAGWFGADALDEWRKAGPEFGSLELIDAETLANRVAAGETLVLDIGAASQTSLVHPDALRFQLDDLPLSLDGLPVHTAICITAATSGIATFTGSLLWNFGFHTLSYLSHR